MGWQFFFHVPRFIKPLFRTHINPIIVKSYTMNI